MIDPLLSLAHTMQSSKGVYALLLGSGVSRSASVPTGWEVTLDLVRRVARLEGEDAGPDPAAWYQARHGAAPDYSRLLDTMAPAPADRRQVLHGYFEPTGDEREQGLKLPTSAHRAIARLAAKGYIKVILTTNFDRLMEIALRDAGVEPVIISNADAADGAAPLVHQRCVVVKLHGDYLDDRIMNTEAELAAYEPRMDAYLDRVLDEFGLVVCGWSGEWDPALRRSFERCKSRRYTTWWAAVGEPGPRAAALLALRQARLVRTTGADSFFTAVEEKVTSLEELAVEHPLTEAAAVASVKRYVAEPRHRIRLQDLLAKEATRVARRLAEELPVQGPPQPTEDEFRRRVGLIDMATRTLRAMFFHTALWSGTDQRGILVRPLRAMLPAHDGNGWNLWLEMQSYPAALLLYAAGLGAVAGGNYGMLGDLLDMRYRVSGRDRSALANLVAARAMDHGNANLLFKPQRRYYPLSEHLLTVLSPLADSALWDAPELFDRLEVLMALATIDASPEISTERQFIPPGPFCWKANREDDHPAARLLQEAQQQGAGWAPLRDGFFKGGVDRFSAVRAAFEQALARVAQSHW
ncbi:SIR2 family protein [Roseomonas sp. USHLN139]|uniref:SIR2 family protein n=1 Tax=Roseomonas sp. USHLN139 TaxID=3081298 RepID=UPI003B015BC2